ncbi:MAG: hypothetical protein QXN05_04035 [Acidilobaceae archaeon]
MGRVLEVDMRPGGSCGDSPSMALNRLASRVETEKPDAMKVRVDPSLISPSALRVVLSQKGYELAETTRVSESDVTFTFIKKK